mmetsp:Transcript_27842/g.66972  ORF Transcript_27842/g.66972 Transcript_27842/m.66972 type:complete len:253 (-) Transcript_27842:9-767(-)
MRGAAFVALLAAASGNQNFRKATALDNPAPEDFKFEYTGWVGITDLIAARGHTQLAAALSTKTADPNLRPLSFAEMMSMQVLSTLRTVGAVCGIFAVLAFVYAHLKEGQPAFGKEAADVEEFTRFRHGLCSCKLDTICCTSWTLCGIRWADTSAMAGIATFFGACVLLIALFFLWPFTFGLTFWAWLGVVVVNRQKIRQQFNMQAGGCTWLEDAVTWLCCCCCATAQEARQLEEAYECGHPAVKAVAQPNRQ